MTGADKVSSGGRGVFSYPDYVRYVAARLFVVLVSQEAMEVVTLR